jgi:hypothetical protein
METLFDATVSERIARLGRQVLDGGRLSPEDALFLFHRILQPTSSS